MYKCRLTVIAVRERRNLRVLVKPRFVSHMTFLCQQPFLLNIGLTSLVIIVVLLIILYYVR